MSKTRLKKVAIGMDYKTMKEENATDFETQWDNMVTNLETLINGYDTALKQLQTIDNTGVKEVMFDMAQSFPEFEDIKWAYDDLEEIRGNIDGSLYVLEEVKKSLNGIKG